MSKGGTTPLMEQYFSIKNKYQDEIVLFQLGDFYEAFFEDAELISKELNIVLTSRSGSPLAGIPVKSLDQYVSKLVKKGYRIAIADQLEDASQAKGLVERGVVRVVTKGTLFEDDLLDSKLNNYIAALHLTKKGRKELIVGLAIADLSTGEFSLTEFTDELSLNKTITELKKYLPSEIIFPRESEDRVSLYKKIEFDDFKPSPLITTVENFWFTKELATQFLRKAFDVSSLDGFGISEFPEGIGSAGALMRYLSETQVKQSLDNFTKIGPLKRDGMMYLDSSSIISLELIRNIWENTSEGTLLEAFDHSLTPMGSRLIRQWLLHPLTEKERIDQRLNAVETLKLNVIPHQEMRTSLDQITDLQRLISRIAMEKSRPMELIALNLSLKQVPKLKKHLEKLDDILITNLISTLHSLPEICELISQAINPTPNIPGSGEVIKKEFNEKLDYWHDILSTSNLWLEEYEEEECQKNDIPNLKVRNNKAIGFYIEVTKSHYSKVPENYELKKHLKNAKRYTTTELQQREQEFLRAEDEIRTLELEIYSQIVRKIGTKIKEIQETAEAIGQLDCLSCFAHIAETRNYCRPEITDSLTINIKQGRHPVIERIMVPEPFIPNDTILNEEERILIITGPNMGGKTTLLRQVALITIMAQMGSFVPAQSAEIGIVDRIFTRVGAFDNQIKQQSTFFIEMTEAANLLNNATERSLVILDEVGRGTSTYDGLSIAWGTVEYLHDINKSRTLFATHYHSLSDLELTLPAIKNYHFDILVEDSERLIFDRRLKEHSTDKSFGIQVAKLAGVPQEVISRASEILKLLDSQVETIDPSINGVKEEEREVLKKLIKEEISGPKQLSIIDFFAEEKGKKGMEQSLADQSQETIESYNKLCKIISKVNLDNMSIIEIQELIQELKREIN